ncbi:MAG: CRISPR-associated endonuclease Cas3'', partial [Acidobacteria bacterium]|nr:CRISPR-associated endonuclease Cas3'' [Acidobacteriota bacterium]
WLTRPDRDLVLVGTQDMLLSRALNRGYGVSRFAWPWHYALVSNDCWWVFDEVQLMGVGLSTGLQLAAFRKQLSTYGSTHTLFMSATLETGWLETVDHPQPNRVLRLSDEDSRAGPLARRRNAPKRLVRASTTIGRANVLADLAKEIGRRHVPGTRTLVVMNTVDRALALAASLEQSGSKAGPRVVLLHSRFRPPDREAALRRALAPDFDGIVVSTQVVEAGVDISSRTLITELAPWPSLVQRAGRCNRTGEYDRADVVWVDHDDPETTAPPYTPEELAFARRHLEALSAFNPAAIEAAAVGVTPPPVARVLRRGDLLDLFDTTPDLSGLDLDVSVFIRDGEERDAQVFWRVLSGTPERDEPAPARDELCSVPFYALRKWAQGQTLWRWNHLDGEWARCRASDVYPGAIFLLDVEAGGYVAARGWSPTSTGHVPVVAPQAASTPPESLDDDVLAQQRVWVELAPHLLLTRAELRGLTKELDLLDLPVEALELAAHLHDLGKAHPIFQETMRRNCPAGHADRLWAKSGAGGRHSRPGFRHELAGALAWLQCGWGPAQDLVAYLMAAHHGKVRMSIRSLPNDVAAPDRDRLFARGVWDGEALPRVDAGDGVILPETALDLSFMCLGRVGGRPSWAERTLKLRDHFGPFRLAYLEMLTRLADVRASMKGASNEP